jgi:hypothetical protein
MGLRAAGGVEWAAEATDPAETAAEAVVWGLSDWEFAPELADPAAGTVETVGAPGAGGFPWLQLLINNEPTTPREANERVIVCRYPIEGRLAKKFNAPVTSPTFELGAPAIS